MSDDVTVLIPVAPRSRWLPDALESLSPQTFPNWTALVVLDGDCERNRQALDASSISSRVEFVINPGTAGLATALNVGLRRAKTDLVARLDADDLCVPERLQSQVAIMRGNTDLWVLGSGAFLIDSRGRQVGQRSVPSSPAAVLRRLKWRNAMIHPSVIMRRERILALGGYNELCERQQDYELWLRVAAAKGLLANINSPLIRYRLHSSQHSRGSQRGEQTAEIRRARRASAETTLGRASADTRHAVWFAAQHRPRWR